MSSVKRLINEIHHRSLWQVLLIYVGGAWFCYEIIDTVAERMALPTWLPVLAILLFVLGLPFVIATAFVREDGPTATVSDPTLIPVDEAQTESVHRRRLLTWRNAAASFVLALAAWGIVAAGWLVFGDRRAAPVLVDRSIAVLPFVNMSGDSANEYFSDGVTEEIITKLASIQSLQVSSRTSVTRFKNTEADISDIAALLGVKYVLEGSVRRAGEKVRITAQLIDSESGFHLWAEDFDGTLEDIFDVQEQTALRIAEALNLQLTPEEKQAVHHRYTENTEAYDAYLQGQALLIFFADRDKLLAAREHFELALSLAPEYAPALAGLASVEAHTYRNIDPSEDRLRRGEQLAMRALEIDSELARALVALGEICAIRYDYVGAEDWFREALTVDPNDPYAWDLLSWALAYQQPPRGTEAEEAAREAIRLQPDFTSAYYHLGRALLLQSRYEEALGAFQHILDRVPDSMLGSFGQAQTYLAMGEFARAEKAAKASMRQGMSPVQQVILSYAYAAQSRMDEALAELERALELDYRDFEALEASPYLSELHEDPRYQRMIARYRMRQ